MPTPKIIFFILITAVMAFELVGDTLLKLWSLQDSRMVLIIGLLMYFIGTVFWAVSLKYESLSKAITIFSVLSLVGAVLVGVFVFNEHLSLPNKVGILLGVISIILVEL